MTRRSDGRRPSTPQTELRGQRPSVSHTPPAWRTTQYLPRLFGAIQNVLFARSLTKTGTRRDSLATRPDAVPGGAPRSSFANSVKTLGDADSAFEKSSQWLRSASAVPTATSTNALEIATTAGRHRRRGAISVAAAARVRHVSARADTRASSSGCLASGIGFARASSSRTSLITAPPWLLSSVFPAARPRERRAARVVASLDGGGHGSEPA